MTISLVLVIAMGVLYACGVYLLLERSMTRVLLGFLLVGNATNLLLFMMAGEPGRAPIAEDGIEPGDITDPLPQALILTAIVITFAVSAFLLALIYRSWRLSRADEVIDDEADRAVLTGEGDVDVADQDRDDSSDEGVSDSDFDDDEARSGDAIRDDSAPRDYGAVGDHGATRDGGAS